MRKVILIALLLMAFYAYSQESMDGHYSIGILPVTSSSHASGYYLENMQAVISSAFTGKTRFTVVDRTKFNQVAAERNLQRQEDFINSSVIVEQGKILGARYLVSGNITQLSKAGGYIEKSRLVLNSANKLATQKENVYQFVITITINVQVIDVETGMVKSNKSLSEITKTETTSEQVAVSNAISGLEASLKFWVNEVFPVNMKIVRVESTNKKGLPETVLIMGGQEMDLSKRTTSLFFSTSSQLLVYENEVLIIDGKEFKRELKVGTIKIFSVQGDLSVCKVKSGAEQIKKKLDEGKTLLLKVISY